jgi:retinol dehydrogenase-12
MDLTFLKSQFTPLPSPTQSFTDLTIIITGANIGLGLEAARHFTRLGASKVVLACRSLAKGEAAIQDIENSTGRKNICEVWQVDISSISSIQSFVSRALQLPRLDILVENAGIANVHYEEVAGHESNIAVNVVGTMFMALSMLPVLRASAKKTGRVPVLSIVGSEVHGFVRTPFLSLSFLQENEGNCRC